MKSLKEGDKLLCRKMFNNLSKVGVHYSINICSGKDKFINVNGFWFSTTLSYPNSVLPYVYDYFFTEQEERKLKLQIIKLQSDG